MSNDAMTLLSAWPLLNCSLRGIPAWLSAKLLSRVRLFVTPWTVACQAPPSMEFSRQEYWSGLPFPSPGDLPDPGIEHRSPALQADALPSEKPDCWGHVNHRARTLWPSKPPELPIFPFRGLREFSLPSDTHSRPPTQRAAGLIVFLCSCLEDKLAKFRQASETAFKIPDDVVSRPIKFIFVSLQPSLLSDWDTSWADWGLQRPQPRGTYHPEH